jgi:hypothetical protein
LLNTTLCDQVCQRLAAGQWFSPVTLVSSTNKTDRHDIAEMLSGGATNTNFIVFGLIRPGLERTIYHTQGEHATDAVGQKCVMIPE